MNYALHSPEKVFSFANTAVQGEKQFVQRLAPTEDSRL